MTRGHFDRDMAGFSAGQRKKVLIAAIEELLLNTESTMIFVEHDRAFCDHVATDSIYM